MKNRLDSAATRTNTNLMHASAIIGSCNHLKSGSKHLICHKSTHKVCDPLQYFLSLESHSHTPTPSARRAFNSSCSAWSISFRSKVDSGSGSTHLRHDSYQRQGGVAKHDSHENCTNYQRIIFTLFGCLLLWLTRVCVLLLLFDCVSMCTGECVPIGLFSISASPSHSIAEMSAAAAAAAAAASGPGGGAHLKKFTQAQLSKKAAERASDVPNYRQLFLSCRVRSEGDSIIVDTAAPQWKKLIQLCKAADEAKQKKAKEEANGKPPPAGTPAPPATESSNGNPTAAVTATVTATAATADPKQPTANNNATTTTNTTLPIPSASIPASSVPTNAEGSTATPAIPPPAAPAAPTQAPTPTPAPATLPLAHSNSIERLFSKAANSLRAIAKDKSDAPKPRDSSPAPIPIPAQPDRRSETPDPGQSISLSSSPQLGPGAPPSAPMGIPPRGVRSGSGSSAALNPFISSLPPPMLPSPTLPVPIVSTGGSSSQASTPPLSTTPSSSSAVNFFKEFINKVSDEMKGINTSSASAAGSSSAASSSTSSSSDPASANLPPFAEPNFLPVVGPFPQPVLSPMLSSVQALTRTPPLGPRSISKLGGRSELDEFASAAAPPLSLSPAPGAKKRRAKRQSEIAEIVRAPAAHLPTPFHSIALKAVEDENADHSIDDEPKIDSEVGPDDEQEGRPTVEEGEPYSGRSLLTASPMGGRRVKKAREGKKKRVAPVKVDDSIADGTPASSSAVSIAPSPLVAPVPVPPVDAPIAAIDGIDMADLVDDPPQPVKPDGEADDGNQPQPQIEPPGEGEGQPQEVDAAHQSEGEESDAGEGDEESTLSFGLISLNYSIRSSLVDFRSSVSSSLSPRDPTGSLLSLLSCLNASHLIVSAVRVDRFGQLGCEEVGMEDESNDGRFMPEYETIVTKAIANIERTKKLRRLNESHFHSTLDEFVHAWSTSFEQTLFALAEPIPIATSAHPATIDAATLDAARQAIKTFSDVLNAISGERSRQQLQDLCLILLQLRLRARLISPSHVAWSPADLLAFIRVYAPLLSRTSVLAACRDYRLTVVLEQLHSTFDSVGPAPSPTSAKTIATIEQRIVAQNAEQVTHAFQSMAKQKDTLLPYRLLHRCFAQVTHSATNFTATSSVYHALEYAAANFPLIEPWLVAEYLNIQVSLFREDDALSYLSDPLGTVAARCADLRAAPQHLPFHASYLDATPASPHATLGHIALDRQAQQYHLYFHYLRTILNVYEDVRRDDDIVLEFIRICMCFGRPKKEALFRPFNERQADVSPYEPHPQANDQPTLVPVRDSHHAANWVHGEMVLGLLRQSDIYAVPRSSLVHLFSTVGFFRGVVSLYISDLRCSDVDRTDSDRTAIIQHCCLIAICADDPHTFEQCVDAFIIDAETQLEERVQIWKHILNQLYSMLVSPAARTIAPRRLSLRVLLSHLLSSIGSPLTVSLLLSSPLYIELCDRCNLPASFYTSILDHAMLRCEQQTIAHSLMESLDSHLWSDRPKNISETTRAVWQAEIAQAGVDANESGRPGAHRFDARPSTAPTLMPFLSSGDSDDEDDHRSSGDASQRPNEIRFKFDFAGIDARRGAFGSSSRWYEDMSHGAHWGASVRIDGATCIECTLPIDERDATTRPNASAHAQLPAAATPLCVFRCGHVAHANCATERGCNRCSEENTN